MSTDRYYVQPLSEGEVRVLRSLVTAAEKGEVAEIGKRMRAFRTLKAKVMNVEKRREEA